MRRCDYCLKYFKRDHDYLIAAEGAFCDKTCLHYLRAEKTNSDIDRDAVDCSAQYQENIPIISDQETEACFWEQAQIELFEHSTERILYRLEKSDSELHSIIQSDKLKLNDPVNSLIKDAVKAKFHRLRIENPNSVEIQIRWALGSFGPENPDLQRLENLIEKSDSDFFDRKYILSVTRLRGKTNERGKKLADAVSMLKLAAEEGSAESASYLSKIYSNGWYGETASPSARLFYVELGADLGSRYCCDILANRFFKGEEVKKDLERAHEFGLRSAEFGDAAAMAWVAQNYSEGTGVLQNSIAGATWKFRAANRRNPAGMLGFALDCEIGNGLPFVSKKRCLHWLKMASRAGNESAKKAYSRRVS